MHCLTFLSLTLALGCSWARPDVSHLSSTGYLPPPPPHATKEDIKHATAFEQPPRNRYRHAQIESIQPSIQLASFTIQTTVPLSQFYAAQQQPTSFQAQEPKKQHFGEALDVPFHFDIPNQANYEVPQNSAVQPPATVDVPDPFSYSNPIPIQNLEQPAQVLAVNSQPQNSNDAAQVFHRAQNQPLTQQESNGYNPNQEIPLQQAPSNAPTQQANYSPPQPSHQSAPATQATQPNYQYPPAAQNPEREESTAYFQPNQPVHNSLTPHQPHQEEVYQQRYQNVENISPTPAQQENQQRYNYAPTFQKEHKNVEAWPTQPFADEVSNNLLENQPQYHYKADAAAHRHLLPPFEHQPNHQPFEDTFILTATIQPNRLSDYQQTSQQKGPAPPTITIERVPHQMYLPPPQTQQNYATPLRQQQAPAPPNFTEQKIPQQTNLPPAPSKNTNRASASPNFNSQQVHRITSAPLQRNYFQAAQSSNPTQHAVSQAGTFANYGPPYQSRATEAVPASQQQAPNPNFEAPHIINRQQVPIASNQHFSAPVSNSFSTTAQDFQPKSLSTKLVQSSSYPSPLFPHQIAPQDQPSSYNHQPQANIHQHSQQPPSTHIQTIPKMPVAQTTVPNLTPTQAAGPYKYQANSSTAPAAEFRSEVASKPVEIKGSITAHNHQLQGTEDARNNGHVYSERL